MMLLHSIQIHLLSITPDFVKSHDDANLVIRRLAIRSCDVLIRRLATRTHANNISQPNVSCDDKIYDYTLATKSASPGCCQNCGPLTHRCCTYFAALIAFLRITSGSLEAKGKVQQFGVLDTIARVDPDAVCVCSVLWKTLRPAEDVV